MITIDSDEILTAIRPDIVEFMCIIGIPENVCKACTRFQLEISELGVQVEVIYYKNRLPISDSLLITEGFEIHLADAPSKPHTNMYSALPLIKEYLGLPKGCMITHLELVAEVASIVTLSLQLEAGTDLRPYDMSQVGRLVARPLKIK